MVLIEDEYGVVSSAVMNSVVSAAYQNWYDEPISDRRRALRQNNACEAIYLYGGAQKVPAEAEL